MSVKRVVLVGLLAVVPFTLAGCGGGDDDGGNTGDDGPVFVLPGLSILTVTPDGAAQPVEVTVELSAADGFMVGVVTIAAQLVFPSQPDVVVTNDVIASTAGEPTLNGVTSVPVPATGTSEVSFTISGDSPDILSTEDGVTLTVLWSDGPNVGSTTFVFDIGLPEGPTEPDCAFVSPTGGTVGGLVPLTVTLSDLQNDDAGATFTYSIDGGATYLPCTLAASSPTPLTPFAPTDPDNIYAGPANQVAGVATPGTVVVHWDTQADLVGLTGRAGGFLRVLVEDGTTAGDGPYPSCATRVTVDNRLPPLPPSAPLTVAPLGDAGLIDPLGVLGGPEVPLGVCALVVATGAGFGAGDAIEITPPGGLLLGSTLIGGDSLAQAPLRSAPDGPGTTLSDTGLASLPSLRFVMVGVIPVANLSVFPSPDLMSLSTDRFTVSPGGTLNLQVQVPSALAGGLEPVSGYAAAIIFDGGALDVVSVQGGTHPDFVGTPDTIPSPATAALDGLGLVSTISGRTDISEPTMNVATVQLRVSDGVLPGSVLHLWFSASDPFNALSTTSGAVVQVGSGLRVLGTSVLVE